MSISVVDLNEGTAKGALNSDSVRVETKQVEEEPPKIEETNEQVIDTFVSNEVVEENNEESKDEVKNEVKEEPKVKAKPLSQSESAGGQRPLPKAKPKASDIVPCPDCNKNMTYKNLRYSHKCSPEPPPVKPQAKPKGKAKQVPKPKPVSQPIYEEEEQETQHEVLSAQQNPVTRQQPPNVNPASALAQHYQLLQQQYMKQKQEKYNNLCSNMFKTKPKKR